MHTRSSRHWAILIAIGATIVLCLALLLAATFPFALAKGPIERSLSRQLGTSVHIGAIAREDRFSLSPVLRIMDVRAAQPEWAGRGDLATIGELRLRLKLPSLLAGRTEAAILSARAIRLNLVRNADGRTNWAGPGDGSRGGSPLTTIGRIDDATIQYVDARQRREMTLDLRVDPQRGLIAKGRGIVDGSPVDIRVGSGPLLAERRWPFDATIEGPALTMRATGAMAAPFRTDNMAFRLVARADDLKRIDRIIEAGLFGTRAVNLSAAVTRKPDSWIVDNLQGSIGSSQLSGSVTVNKRNGRTLLAGKAHFRRLDFEDLASERGNAEALALERTQGVKLVPNTRINISKIDKTDGRIHVSVDRLVGGRRPTSLTDLAATLDLRNRRLIVHPLKIGLRRGSITGRAEVDQRSGEAKPRITLTLAIENSSLAALASGAAGQVEGKVEGRMRLTGTGDTVREAVGHADGRMGLVVHSGVLPSKRAALLGFDVGKALFGDDDEQASLNCAVLSGEMRGGMLTLRHLIVDTSISQAQGSGTIRFPSEELNVRLTGKPKGDAAVRVPGSVLVRGFIRAPDIVVPRSTKSVGNILKAVGRAIGGEAEPKATNADCTSLRGATIRWASPSGP
ncbi:hypothetical protein SAMN06295912_1212 [Sphingomonas laterariae]|uniref:AsmA domain-containing protein n=1 Tax=Edaphosphingomonas laterariae TaxID=861865 RepID=A0A239I201_9SPHN|nr:AsmA family protein [Sphingomonas laterariae]SNS87625.1 hypothetical protein SAMN06295912_1212 [Sphingomonas laterariae]